MSSHPERPIVSLALVVILAGVVPAIAADPGHYYYYYEGQKIALEVEADQISVGLYPGRSLPATRTFDLASGPLLGASVPLSDSVWRVELGERDALVTDGRLTADPPSRAPLPDKADGATRLQAELERQQQVLQQLRDDPAVEWVYPAFRNPETGTLLWLTPDIVVGVDPRLTEEDVAELLPENLRLDRALFAEGMFLLRLAQPGLDEPLAVAAALVEGQDWVRWAEPDFIQDWSRHAVPNDPLFTDQWHLKNTGQGAPAGVVGADGRLEGAWDVQAGDGSIIVAVIDDGVELTHPDFASHIWTNPGEIPGNGVDDDSNGYIDDVNGWDFKDNDNDPNPDLTGPGSHGTAVAGVAAAVGNNSLGVSGACQDCRILSARVFDAVSGTSDAGFGAAIDYAGIHADVLNNSWGGGSPSAVITTAIQGAVSGGRGGLGSPTLFSNGNSASGYVSYGLSGLYAGTWTYTFTYEKDEIVSAGFDTFWLDNVIFPDGSVEEFEGCSSLPSGWTSSGDAAWIAVNDETRASSARGGNCSIRAGTITDNGVTSVSVTKSHGAEGVLLFEGWPSSEPAGPLTSACWDNFYLVVSEGMNTYGPFFYSCGTWSNQGTPLLDGVISYPSSLTEAISVGAASNFDRRSDYSQWGSGNDFVCHSNGGSLGITTTDVVGANGYDPTDYTDSFGGTSSAAPLCSGIAALILSQDPSLTETQVRSLMQSSARKIGPVPYSSGYNDNYGYGAVNADQALAGLASSSIVVTKQTMPDGDPTTFTFSGDVAGVVGDGAQLLASVGAGTYTSTETVPSGWSLISIQCDDTDSTGDVGTATATFQVAAAETVNCVFTNCSDTVGSTVNISGETVTGTETFEACDTLTVDTTTVTGTGDLLLSAGNTVVIENGTSVLAGGDLTVGTVN
jgi:subtilisin family serine protease